MDTQAMTHSVQPCESPIAKNDPREGDQGAGADADAVCIDFARILQERLTAFGRHSECGAANKDSLDKLLHELEPLLWRVVKARRSPGEDCDDDLQELRLTVIACLKGFQLDPNRGAFEDWISVVLQNRLVDNKRCRLRHPMSRLGALEADKLPGREPDPVEAFERKHRQELVRAALDELHHRVKERDFKAFCLRWIEGRSVKEIAARLGMNEQQVWSSHHRTRLKLLPLLQERLGRRP